MKQKPIRKDGKIFFHNKWRDASDVMQLKAWKRTPVVCPYARRVFAAIKAMERLLLEAPRDGKKVFCQGQWRGIESAMGIVSRKAYNRYRRGK